ncbi:MAG: helix-turn-helix transcriptional regulator [Caldilineaceae bacterium]
MIDDQLVKRIRNTVLDLQEQKERSLTPVDTAEEKLRQSVSTAARSRVSSLLRQLRGAHGYSYETLAAESGLSQQLLYDVEYKERRLTLDQLRTVANCYGIGVNDLLGVDIE